jgi:HAD superfamily hydrolase (TIGR01509 family)
MRSADEINALRQDYFSGDRLNYRLLALIHDLRDQGCLVALLSNDSIELETRLRDLGLDDHFDHVLISARMGVMKPDLTAYRVALQALGAAPHEALLVDDSLVNVRGAQPLGLQTILFRPELDLRAEIEKRLKEAEG